VGEGNEAELKAALTEGTETMTNAAHKETPSQMRMRLMTGPVARKAAEQKQAASKAREAAVNAVTNRALGLLGVSKQAALLGVPFDFEAAMISGTSVADALTQITSGRAQTHAPETAQMADPKKKRSTRKPMTSKAKEAWEKALKPKR
jgi:hypothetical protein